LQVGVAKIFWDWSLKAVVMVKDEGEEGDKEREREMLGMASCDRGRRKGGQVNLQKCLSPLFLF